MRFVKFLPLAKIVCYGLLCGTVGCGGGTTGTSPTESLKFSGVAVQSNQRIAPALSMSVRSSRTDEVLVTSGTNKQGLFSMTLPADEESFVITVDRVGSAVVSRNTRGEAVATARLAVTRDDTLAAERLSEAQVDKTTLCSSLVVSSDRLIQQSEVSDTPCQVTIKVTAPEVAIESLRGSVTGVCDGQQIELAQSSLSPMGEVTFDLQQAFARGCSALRISIQDPQNPDLSQIFRVE